MNDFEEFEQNSVTQKWEEIYTYIKGYASIDMPNTSLALAAAMRFHGDQTRDSGEPYIIHPLMVTLYLLNLGIDNDVICAASILHDVIEDQPEKTRNGEILEEEYGISREVINIVRLLTKDKSNYNANKYYENISKNKDALLIKLSDRANNCSTMSVFTPERMNKYVKETKEYIYNLCKYGKTYYPEFSNQITIMKYQIVSICETIDALLNNEFENLQDHTYYRKTFEYIRGVAKRKNLTNTLIALPLCEKLHAGQLRKSGDPFIIHPLRVASYLIALKIYDDETLAAALLHEVFKKCQIQRPGTILEDKYRLSHEVVSLINLVSKHEKIPIESYYENLKQNYKALLIKLSNRANTCTTLKSCEEDEITEYLKESNDYIFPLCDFGIDTYPEYSDQIENMKYHISSIGNIVLTLYKHNNTKMPENVTE